MEDEGQKKMYAVIEDSFNGFTEIWEEQAGKPLRKIDPKSEEGRKLLDELCPDKVAPHTLDPHIKKGHNILDSLTE